MTRTREEIAREVAGFVLCVVGLLTILAVVSYHPLDPSFFVSGSDRISNWLSVGGAAIAGLLIGLLGVPGAGVPILLIVLGWCWIRGEELKTPVLQTAAWTLALGGADGLLAVLIARVGYRGGELALGGDLGSLLARALSDSLGGLGALLVTAAALLIGVVLGVKASLRRVFDVILDAGARRRAWVVARLARRRDRRRQEELQRKLVAHHQERHPPTPAPPLIAVERHGVARFRVRRVHQIEIVRASEREWAGEDVRGRDLAAAGFEPATGPLGETVAHRPGAVSCSTTIRPKPIVVQEVFDFVTETPASALPEKTMLALPQPLAPVDPQHLAAMRELIEARCQEFRVAGRVEDVLPGPIITTYEFRPAAGVKYAQVVALEDDLALGLQVEAVRIERIPGKATVGIEVPNPERQTIVLREILESPKFLHSASPLTLALGKDIHGRPFVADLARMPHLLIGGFTGSGKSVGINAMIMSILFKAQPAEVRFILIDPKQVEMGMYDKLPHLLTPIISDPREAARALKWAVREMRDRYQLLAACKVRNLAQYNALLGNADARAAAVQAADGVELRTLPYIVVIIDELADLMMTCASDVEDSIGHLAQMARAVGIHLIFATQRPSVDIITGVIKANFPCRIAYKVRTRFDSRTVLDTEGAECLLGSGDMLFLPPGTSRPMRLHGCFVREEEILTVLKHLRRLGKPEFDQRVVAEPEPGSQFGGSEDNNDPMYQAAARLVVASRKASASYLQRKLKLGYSRSARLLDIMEQEGLVGPTQGSRGREVLVAPEYFGEVDASHVDDGQEDPNA